MEWRVWITRWLLFCFRYSRLYIIKKYDTLTAIPPIYVYINRINNRLVFKIKDGYRLELQTPETIKIYGSTKKQTDKSSLQEVEVLLVECNLVDNQY